MSCRACEHPGEGHAHTCPSSGTFVAAEAHVAGEVDAIREAWPRYDIGFHFVLASPDEETARRTVVKLVSELMDDDDVEHTDISIAERAVAA